MKRRTAILTILIFSLIACQTVPSRPDYCRDKPSLIYTVADQVHIDPRVLDSLLLYANLEALRHNCYLPQQVRYAVSSLRALLQGNPTYADVVQLALAWTSYINQYAGSVVVALSTITPYLDRPVPLLDCDRQLILTHLNRQEAMLDTLFPESKSELPQ
jgi:hypothetical protein